MIIADPHDAQESITGVVDPVEGHQEMRGGGRGLLLPGLIALGLPM